MLKSIYQRIPIPFKWGLKFNLYYHWANILQLLPLDYHQRYKDEKLQKIIMHAYLNVPYYKELFDSLDLKPADIQTEADLKKLPILTKEDVRRNFGKLQARDMGMYKPQLTETGGSTGKPLKIYIDDNLKKFHHALVWRFRKWAGLSFRDKWIVMRYTVFAEGKISETNKNVKNISSFNLSKDTAGDYVKEINDFSPVAIWGFPSTLSVLAAYILFKNIKMNSSLKAILTASETLSQSKRELIELAFGCKVFDFYGSNETVIAAMQCEEGNYHITEHGILEIVDGCVVGTTLHNYSMPLIRYNLEDTAVLSEEKCPCGKPYPILKSIEGRLDDNIITAEEKIVGRLDEAFHYSNGIYESQILQDKVGEITVKIVKAWNFSEKDTEKLDIELRKRLGKNMKIHYQLVTEIPKTLRGKHRFVINSLKGKGLNENN